MNGRTWLTFQAFLGGSFLELGTLHTQTQCTKCVALANETCALEYEISI